MILETIFLYFVTVFDKCYKMYDFGNIFSIHCNSFKQFLKVSNNFKIDIFQEN